MKQYKSIIRLILMGAMATACANLEKEVDIKLPEYESQLTVECYLERNQNVRVTVTETQDYFGEIQLPFLDSTTNVVISWGGNSQKLRYNNVPQIDNRGNFKMYNFLLDDSIPLPIGQEVFITVNDSKGRMATASTRWLPPVPIDSVYSTANNDGEHSIICNFSDNAGTKDYYRFRVNKLPKDTSIRGGEPDYFSDDKVFNGKGTFGSRPIYRSGDTVEVTLYHMTPEYFEFLNTAVAASQSNGNPFATPATIKSNIKGGMGIFTTLSYARRLYVIP